MTYSFTVEDDRPGFLRVAKVSKKTGKASISWVPVLAQNARQHWRSRHLCMKKDIEKVLLLAPRPPEPLQKAHVIITLYVTADRRRDAQMLETCKGVLDGLTQAGVIVDDNLDVIGTPELRIERRDAYGYKVEVIPA